MRPEGPKTRLMADSGVGFLERVQHVLRMASPDTIILLTVDNNNKNEKFLSHSISSQLCIW